MPTRIPFRTLPASGALTMGIAVALTVVTGADYVRQTLAARREQLS